jgi:hypothetical protein
MSLTSYQAAPPRVLFESQVGSILETRNLISELSQRDVGERSSDGIVIVPRFMLDDRFVERHETFE